MKAAIFTTPPAHIEVGELPRPKAGPGEILVEVGACGLCHTDLHYLDHGVPTYLKPPIVLGHEAAGIVAEVGEGTEGWETGSRVLIPAVFSCGSCAYCRSGRENLCARLEMLGNHRHGALAEYVAVPARDCLILPEEISVEAGCLIADALSTAYHAIDQSGVGPADTVAVIGCGGMGVNLVQCAVLAGARVIAVDRVASKLEKAVEFGAEETINTAETDVPLPKILRKLTSGGPDAVFEAIGVPETIQAGLAAVRKGGALYTVGYCGEAVPLAVGRVMFFELEVRGSLGCPARKYPAIVDLVRRGKLEVEGLVSGLFPLDEVEEGLNRLRSGEGFRWVIQP